MSPVWCSTSFEHIEHTGSIIHMTQIHSIAMSPVWCSTCFEDIEHTGFLCLNFRVLPLLKTSITQIHSIPMSHVSH